MVIYAFQLCHLYSCCKYASDIKHSLNVLRKLSQLCLISRVRACTHARVHGGGEHHTVACVVLQAGTLEGRMSVYLEGILVVVS